MAPPDQNLQSGDLDRAVRAVVEDCLGVREGEDVLVIANPATLGLGERLRGQSGRAGADAVLALMAERASHAGEPPAPVAAAMREEIATFLANDVKDPRIVGLVTVTAVDVSRDLRHAKVFVSVLGSESQRAATIEGLAEGDALHPLQQAFVTHDGFQCGYCTPGQICSAVGMLEEGKANSSAEVQEMMSGNLCRCGAYGNIRAAIEDVMQEGKQ